MVVLNFSFQITKWAVASGGYSFRKSSLFIKVLTGNIPKCECGSRFSDTFVFLSRLVGESRAVSLGQVSSRDLHHLSSNLLCQLPRVLYDQELYQ